MNFGRKQIFTDEIEINADNIFSVLEKAMVVHMQNASDCKFLLDYEKGNQPLRRNKTYRKDIDIVCNDNVANEIAEFKLGFNWGNPITLIRRGIKDSNAKLDESDPIALLNECYDTAGVKAKTQELARFIEICGVGYTYIDVNMDYNAENGDSFFNLKVLKPETTFVVRNSQDTDKVLMGVTFTRFEDGRVIFTCFTPSARYEILNGYKIVNGEYTDEKYWMHRNRSGEINPLGMIPIIEWTRAFDRMGCFERQIPEMDNLNILISDMSNDVDQNTQAIWHMNDCDLQKDENGNYITPESNDWLQTESTPDGKQPFIKPLSIEYDYTGMLNNIITRRALILQKCNVPQRNDNSGGSTGIAMSDATGWSAAESSACKEQLIIEECKMQEVRVVLRALQKSDVDRHNPMFQLRACDIQPNIKRQKTYELTTKVNFFATAVAHGINGFHALKVMNAFEDVNQVWADSKETIEEFQRNVVSKGNNEGRLSADESDQIGNSPNLQG